MRKKLLIAATIMSILLLVVGFYSLFAEARYRSTLYYGSTGEDVRVVQQKLRNWGYYNGPIDGYYGGKTFQAVRLFQQKNGLKVDGIVGRQTWQALGEPVKPVSYQGRARATGQNTYLLAQLISAEARGEPFEGMVAVGAVILNRVESAAFPNTLAGVIYQPLAFEPVMNGTIYNPPVPEAIRAANLALSGWDPTYGCLYFWNPATARNPWVWRRTIVRRIGNHVFAK